jgi:heme oxygenase
MWAGFRGHLLALDERGADQERTVAAARRTFALFERACA